MKRLIVMRHAKSNWSDPGCSDFDRTLNDRGRKAAPEMGRRLLLRGVQPHLVLSSPARRAMHTAQLLSSELGYPKADIEYVDQLYAASEPIWLQTISELPASADVVIMVGHNPEITEVAARFCPERIHHMPTAATLDLEFDVVQWTTLEAKKADRWFFDYPKRTS